MDVCRTIVVTVLALALVLLQMSEGLSYDAQGWHLAAVPVADAKA